MGKQGGSWAQVFSQSTPAVKATLAGVSGAKSKSWSMNWPHCMNMRERPGSETSLSLGNCTIWLETSRTWWEIGRLSDPARCGSQPRTQGQQVTPAGVNKVSPPLLPSSPLPYFVTPPLWLSFLEGWSLAWPLRIPRGKRTGEARRGQVGWLRPRLYFQRGYYIKSINHFID